MNEEKQAEGAGLADLRVQERGICSCGQLEFVRSTAQVLFQFGAIRVLVQPVDRPSPEGKAAPVLHARGVPLPAQWLELLMEALEGRSIAGVVGLLDSGDDLRDALARRPARPRVRGREQERQEAHKGCHGRSSRLTNIYT